MGKRTIGTLNGGKPTVIWRNQIAAQDSPAWQALDESKLELITCPECEMPRRITEFAAGLKRCKWCQSKRMQAGKKPVLPPPPPPPTAISALASDEKWFCRGCSRTLPLTTEYFFREVSRPSGFRTNCKDCTMGRTKRGVIEVANILQTGVQPCSKCGVEKPRTAEYFDRDKGRPDGLRSYCKGCRRPVYTQQEKPQKKEKTRYCDWCNTTKDLTSENFYHKKGRGYDKHCKVCRRDRQRALEAGAPRFIYRGPYASQRPEHLPVRDGSWRTKKHPSLWRRFWRYLMGHKVV